MKELPQHIIKLLKNTEPFKDEFHIPHVPVLDNDIYNDVIIPYFISRGAIPKNNLETGCTYIGDCRNANRAIWNGEYFIYQRTKFGYTYNEAIKTFDEPTNGESHEDVFVPIKKI